MMADGESVSALARRIGLSESTIRELFEKGWTYQSALGQPSRWLDPSARLLYAPVMPDKAPDGAR